VKRQKAKGKKYFNVYFLTISGRVITCPLFFQNKNYNE